MVEKIPNNKKQIPNDNQSLKLKKAIYFLLLICLQLRFGSFDL